MFTLIETHTPDTEELSIGNRVKIFNSSRRILPDNWLAAVGKITHIYYELLPDQRRYVVTVQSEGEGRFYREELTKLNSSLYVHLNQN